MNMKNKLLISSVIFLGSILLLAGASTAKAASCGYQSKGTCQTKGSWVGCPGANDGWIAYGGEPLCAQSDG